MKSLKIRINKKDHTWFVILFIFLMENCFKLINTNSINISGVFAYSDIWLGLFILFFGLKYIKYLPIKSKYTYSALLILMELSCCVAAIQQNFYTGQSISLGIRPQRNFMIILLSYFVIRKMSDHLDINWDKLLNAMLLWGTLSAVLYIAQKIVYPSVQFLYALMNYRNGTLRIYVDSALIDIAILIASYKYFSEYKRRYLCTVLIGFVYLFWVSQGRMEIISILFGVAVGFLVTRKLDKKKFILWFCVILLIAVFFSTEYGTQLVTAITSAKTLTTEQGNTMAIRYIGRERYFEQLFSSARSLIFGCGYPNSLYAPATYRAGFNLNIGLNDNGIFGFFYVYGLLGVGAIIAIMLVAVKMSIKIYKSEKNSLPLMYLAMILLMAYNVIFWYWNADGTFILVLMLCYIEAKYRECKFEADKKE